MLRLLALSIALLWAGASFADSQEDAKKHMKEGVKLLNAQKYTEAILVFQKALAVLPEAAGPHREIGKCYQKLGRFDEALDHYTEYLTRKPDAAERPEIEKNIALSRQKLEAKGRGLISIKTEPSGASVYALTETGEIRGLGVSPIEQHPLELRFIKIRVVSPKHQPLEESIALSPSRGEILSLTIPEKTPEEKLPASAPTVPTSAPAAPSAPDMLTAAQVDASSLQKIEQLEEERKERPIFAYVLLGVSGASALTSAAFGAKFFLTTREMNQKINQLPEVEGAEEDALRGELTALEADAKKFSLLTDIALGGVALTGATGLALLIQARRFERSTSLVQITPSSRGIVVSVSY